MDIIELLLSPFLFIIEKLFQYNYLLCENYGLSILLLSFEISLILLPLFILIEKVKKHNDAIKARMKPLHDEIKRCYIGQERYYYLKTLNRQYNYSTSKALIPVLSLFVQIPFFIAVYQFLEEFKPMGGVDFLFIKDLQAPDEFLGQLNILPIIMTLVNLITVYYYTRFGNKSERAQMLVIAVIFLVLLFNLPSGLVLYWTINNVFGFFRLFITNPEVFKRNNKKGQVLERSGYNFKKGIVSILPQLRHTFVILFIISILSQLNWAFHNNFDNIAIRLIGAFAASISLMFLLAILVLYFDLKISLKNGPCRRTFIGIFLILAVVSAATQINWSLHNNFDDIVIRISLGILLSWVIIIVVANILVQLMKRSRFSITELRNNAIEVIPKLKTVYTCVLLLSILAQIQWFTQHNITDILLRLIITILLVTSVTFFVGIIKSFIRIYILPGTKNHLKTGILYSMVFLSLYFYLASRYYYSGINTSLNIIAWIFLAPVQIIIIDNLIRYRKKISSALFYSNLLLIGIVYLVQVLNINFYITQTEINHYLLSKFNVTGQPTDITFWGLLSIVISIPLYRLNQNIKTPPYVKSYRHIYLLSVLYIIGFIFLWNPLIVYSTYPDNFVFPAINILANNIVLFLIFALSSIVLYKILPDKGKWISLVFILSLAILSFVHNTIVPIDLGTLQENQFANQDNLSQPIIIYILESLMIVFIIILVRWILIKSYCKQIIIALLVLNSVLMVHSLIEAINTGSFIKKKHNIYDTKSTISFSKDKENIVFIIADMFHGGYIERIFKETPEIKDVFEGFTWYPNTLSISSRTCSSMGPILGGHDYSIDKLNKNKNNTLEEKLRGIYTNFCQRIKHNGYSLTSTQLRYTEVAQEKADIYLPTWDDEWNKWNNELNIGLSKETGYMILRGNATFYSAPLLLKPRIYNNGNWFQHQINSNRNTSQAQAYNFLRVLPYISDTNSQTPRFIFLHTYASHFPWDIIDSTGSMQSDLTPFENNVWTLNTIAKWIMWMKKNGVYDNTKIVLLSDHSPHWFLHKDDIYLDIPLANISETEVNIKDIMSLFALLLVKDFNSKEAFKIDNRLMSNADAPDIIFENNYLSKEYSDSRVLTTSCVELETKIWLKKELNITQIFEVKDNIFDLKNWKIVDTE